MHLDFGLLLAAELQRSGGKHDGNLPAKQLPRHWPVVLDRLPLLLRLVLSQRERNDLHESRSRLHPRGAGELSRCREGERPLMSRDTRLPAFEFRLL